MRRKINKKKKRPELEEMLEIPDLDINKLLQILTVIKNVVQEYYEQL